MEKFELIAIIALTLTGFIVSFFIKKVSPKIQLVTAIMATLTLLITTIQRQDEKYSFILIVGLAWIIKSIQGIRESKI